jgi:hypothetical protein
LKKGASEASANVFKVVEIRFKKYTELKRQIFRKLKKGASEARANVSKLHKSALKKFRAKTVNFSELKGAAKRAPCFPTCRYQLLKIPS